MGDAPFSRKMGRGLLRALAGLFGKRKVRKARDSIELLRDEFEAGKREAAEEQPGRLPRPIPHRDLGTVSDPDSSGEP